MLKFADYKKWYDENPKYANLQGNNAHLVALEKINGKIKVIFILNAETMEEVNYD